MTIKKVGILTGGGDCPGLNAVIRAITRTAIIDYGWDVLGIQDGFEGAVEGRATGLSFEDVSNILPQGGTILGTSNKANPFDYKLHGKNGDHTQDLIKNFEEWQIDVLFSIGGDGTLSITNKLQEIFPNVIGIPKTIDNDLLATDQTFGFDTACNFVTEAVDRIHSTAQSHHRCMVIEVMGRYAGWIALNGGMAGGGDIILIPEIPFEFEKITEAIEMRRKRGKKFSIVVASEGAHPKGQDYVVKKQIADSPDPLRLGGVGQLVADTVEEMINIETRVTVLGHLQRGGSPSFYDRVLATSYGCKAVEMAANNEFGKMVALKNGEITYSNLGEAIAQLKLVTPDHQFVKIAKSLGTSFGV